MASIILTSKHANKDDLAGKASLIKETLNAELIVIADSSLLTTEIDGAHIPSENMSYGAALKEALRQATSEDIVLLRSEAAITGSELAMLSKAAEQIEDQEIAFLRNDSSSEDMTCLDAESMLRMIVMKSGLSLAAVASKKTSLLAAINDETESFEEATLRLTIKASAGDAEMINLGQVSAASDSSEEAFSHACASRSLSYIVNSFAIEDLFPQQAWKEHSEASAANAYHTLAAYFLRFSDFANAMECIKLSEQFEESPRSLALKALVAFNRGETLGAVAHLVSCLQQYEEKKKAPSADLTVSAIKIEEINTSLLSGLDALNRRDNEGALDHFAKAVFNFDGFYAKHGLDSLIH